VRTVAQLLGVVLAGVGLALVWSPWALVIAGGLLLVGPELVALRDLRREAVRSRDARRDAAGPAA
jgi:hypothetical protein